MFLYSSIKTTRSKPKDIQLIIICHFEWHWKSRKGISSKIEDPVNPENATEHSETRNESAIEHVKKPYGQGDIIPITEGDGESSRKKRPWDSKEEEESTMTFKRIRFEAIPEEARNNREVPDEMAKNVKKYFESSTNKRAKGKEYGWLLCWIVEGSRKEEGDFPGWYFQEVTVKSTNDYGTP